MKIYAVIYKDIRMGEHYVCGYFHTLKNANDVLKRKTKNFQKMIDSSNKCYSHYEFEENKGLYLYGKCCKDEIPMKFYSYLIIERELDKEIAEYELVY